VGSTTLPTQLPAYQRQMLTAKLLIMHFAMVGFRKLWLVLTSIHKVLIYATHIKKVIVKLYFFTQRSKITDEY